MRLIHVQTQELREFSGTDIPRYAILSHCWGDKEVTFADINVYSSEYWEQALLDRNNNKAVAKIEYARRQAEEDCLDYLWVDTCCIDKSSSAELSEAINSMYAWYRDSKLCYAYLEDVNITSLIPDNETSSSEFIASRWFTRAWTLQELLAPRKGKPSEKIQYTSIASRMSWAATRKATRIEDVAYSLLGLFDVNMALLYGEGTKAFFRLQEEILKHSNDQSIFAWHFDAFWAQLSSPLAESPARFLDSGDIVRTPSSAGRKPYSMTHNGLKIEVPMVRDDDGNSIAVLECQQHKMNFAGLVGITLKTTDVPSVYVRASGKKMAFVPHAMLEDAVLTPIYISKAVVRNISLSSTEMFMLSHKAVNKHGFKIVDMAPERFPWNEETQTVHVWSEVGIDTQAAFRLRSDQWDTSILIVFRETKSRKSNGRPVRMFKDDGSDPLNGVLERSLNSFAFSSSDYMSLGLKKISDNSNSKILFRGIVEKRQIFNQSVIVFDVSEYQELV